jgi:hypothetical protein
MIIHPAPQSSEAWEAIRRGKVTASRFSDIVTPAKCEVSKSATGLIYELIAETIETDAPPDFIGNRWTDRGLELENEAADAFAAQTGLELIPVGFVTQDNGVVGCSPDRFIIDPVTLEPVSGLEMKCPAPKEHVATVAGGCLPDKHRAQVHGGMVVTGFSEWWFESFCPGMQPFILKVERDDYTEKLTVALADFVIRYAAARAALIPQLLLKAA